MPLTKDKDKLNQEHTDLKTRFEREYDELAERKRSFQQETETLLALNNRIKESVIPSEKFFFFFPITEKGTHAQQYQETPERLSTHLAFMQKENIPASLRH